MADEWRDDKSGKRDGKSALVDKTRQEREERGKRKKQEAVAVQVQSLVRGFLARCRTKFECEREISQKLLDIGKVQQVLKLAKKPDFVLPGNASVRLSRCTWMLCRLTATPRPSKKKPVAGSPTPPLVLSVARLLAGTVSSGALEPMWDEGCILRTGTLVCTELKSESTVPMPLTRSLVCSSSAKLSAWVMRELTQKYVTLVKVRLEAADTRSVEDTLDLLVVARSKTSDKTLRGKIDHIIMTSPGLFSRASSPKLFEAIASPQTLPGILSSLGSVSLLSDDNALAWLGNIFSLVFKYAPTLQTDEVFVSVKILMNRAPDQTFSGNEGVSWNVKLGAVAQVDQRVLAQLDFAGVSQKMMRAVLRVNSHIEARLRPLSLDETSFAAVSPSSLASSALTGSSSTWSTTTATKRKSIFTIMSGSSWARALGWSSSSSSKTSKKPSEPDAEDEEPLLPSSPTAAFSSGNVSTSSELFLRQRPIIIAFLETVAIFLRRWPPKSSNPKSFATLNALSFSPRFLERIWHLIETDFATIGKSVATRPTTNEPFYNVLFAFSFLASHALLITDESELYEKGEPLSRATVESIVKMFNEVVIRYVEATVADTGEAKVDGFEVAFVSRCMRLLTQLWDLHSRRPLTSPQAWLVDRDAGSSSASSSVSIFKSLFGVRPESKDLLSKAEQVCFSRGLYWCVSFSRRAEYFSRLISEERAGQQPAEGPFAYRLEVRRRVNNTGFLDDKVISFFAKSDLRKRMCVVFTNEFGLAEAGIDSRGLTKEFIQGLAETIFDPRRGLFAVSQDGDGALFPSPQARAYLGGRDEALRMFNFAGRVLGKALYEGIVIQPEFSLFILAKLLNKLVTISELQSLDKELFKNLVFLKNTDLDVRALGLTFAIESPLQRREVELYPGGSSVEVNNSNRFMYVNMVAHYRLNVECKEEHDAFVGGFRAVVTPEWIQPFSERELQRLISGNSSQLDVKDWRANTVYRGGYMSSAQVVHWFWQIVETEMTDEERALLLRFVTACTRAPLLGFAHLEPKFAIQRVSLENMQLPTSSTCFNTLKLPPYPSKAVLKQKLLQAVKSNSGFDLT